MDDFAECQRVCRRLLDIVTDDLLLTDLKITSAFVSCLLEEPSEKQSEIHEQLELLNRHPSLYDTFMSLRHRILLTMRKYQQLQLILDPQTLEGDSPVATMRKLYDSILLAIVEEQLGKMDKAKVFFAKALPWPNRTRSSCPLPNTLSFARSAWKGPAATGTRRFHGQS